MVLLRWGSALLTGLVVVVQSIHVFAGGRAIFYYKAATCITAMHSLLIHRAFLLQ